MLWAILKNFWRQQLTKQQLYSQLLPITKTIQFRRTRHARYRWRSKDELKRWIPSHRRAKAGRPARTYIQHLCTDTGYTLEDLPGAMDDHIYPTPQLGQDMTQGQFLSGVLTDASLLNTQHYKVRIKGKVEPSREGVAPSPTSWCSSYRKGSLRVTLDYGRQLTLTGLNSEFSFS